jgi:hypothetical protein
VIETTVPEGMNTPVRRANADALRAAPRSLGSTAIGVTNVLKEMEN